MMITFAQYCILTATYSPATTAELQGLTTLEQLMINYYLMGLVKMGLVEPGDSQQNEAVRYELTELGLLYIDDYERANPELVIKRTVYETKRI